MENPKSVPENTVVIIPSYEPSRSFVDYVNELVKKRFKEVLVVNDGSNDSFSDIFNALENIPRCKVTGYEENHGKGHALKYAFRLCKDLYDENTVFVTADCDGQHLVCDVERVAAEVFKTPDRLILGARDFSLAHVPARSRRGNVFTRRMYKFLYGLSLEDTQTGLRAFSYSLLDELIEIKGERFEYEMNMLVVFHKKRRIISEIPITTVYHEEMEDGAKVSHYRTFRDSVRVMSILLKNLGWYFISSVVSAILEVVAFYLITRIVLSAKFGSDALTMLLPTVGARILSSIFNFIFNFKVVFRGKSRRSIFRYYLLWVVQLGISYAIACGLNALFALTSLPDGTVALLITLCKGICDLLIGILSYGIQRAYVFSDPEQKKTDPRNK